MLALNTLRIRQVAGLDAWHPACEKEVQGFLIDRQARGLATGTVRFYEQKLAHLTRFMAGLGLTEVEQVTPRLLRQLLLQFSAEHSEGGTHALYRAVKAFLNWYGDEAEPADWRNPILKVKAPKVSDEPLDPAPVDTIKAMLATCKGKAYHDLRDKAVLLTLLDTGLRASELVALNVGDLTSTGSVLVRQGKGGKVRTVFLGSKTLREVTRYLRLRGVLAGGAPLFATEQGSRLKYEGLRDIVRRRAEQAGVPAPTLHSFRRAFALACLRHGVDVYSLQRLMGHADLSVLRRYLAQTEGDLRRAHERGGPVDRLL
jgi:integrase/recombinase XerC/integrase/recombinase XerD